MKVTEEVVAHEWIVCDGLQDTIHKTTVTKIHQSTQAKQLSRCGKSKTMSFEGLLALHHRLRVGKALLIRVEKLGVVDASLPYLALVHLHELRIVDVVAAAVTVHLKVLEVQPEDVRRVHSDVIDDVVLTHAADVNALHARVEPRASHHRAAGEAGGAWEPEAWVARDQCILLNGSESHHSTSFLELLDVSARLDGRLRKREGNGARGPWQWRAPAGCLMHEGAERRRRC